MLVEPAGQIEQWLRSEPIGIECRELSNKGEDGHVRQPSCCAAKLGAQTQPRIQRMEQVERGSTVWGRIAAIAFGIFSTVEMMLEWPVIDRAQRCVLRRHRSEERRVGKECVSPCRSRWSPSL